MSARHRQAKQKIRDAKSTVDARAEIVESYDRVLANMIRHLDHRDNALVVVRLCRNLADQHRQDAVEHLDELVANFAVDFPKLSIRQVLAR
jgi:L-lactate utilization protein LutB